ISLKRLKLHKAHTFMSVCGIALGVSAIVSIGIVSTSVVSSFEESIISIAGRSSLQVTGAQAGFPEAMLERVQAVQGVEYAVPVIETAATLVGEKDRSIMIIGVDMLQDQHIRDYHVTEENTDIPDPLLFLAKRDSVLVTRGMAQNVGTIAMDRSIRIEAVQGVTSLTVRGFLEPVGPAKTMGDSLAVMDIYAAQAAFGKEGRIDRIDVSIRQGEETEAVRKRILAVLPEGYTVDSPAARSAQIEGILSNTKRNMSTIAFTAILIGMYLIYNAVSITVVHRRREIGILRALGASRGGIVALFLSETAAISLLGSALGIGFGVLFAHGSMETVGKSIAVQYQLSSTSAVPVLISGGHIVTGFVIGIITSILAALFPSLAAARITPVSAIRSLPFSEEEFISRRKLLVLSVVLLAAAAGLFFLYGTARTVPREYLFTLIMTCQFCLLFGATFALPTVLRFTVSFFQRSIASRLGAVSRLAGLNIRKNINRNAVAAGAVFLAITLFINISNMIFSVRTSVMQWLSTSANADLFITAGHPFSGQSGKHVPMPLEMQDEIGKMAGVRLLDIYRQTFIPFKGSKILVESIDVRNKLEYSTLMVTKGGAEDIGKLLPGQNNVIASENLAVRYDIKPGDTLVLTTPAGPVPFKVIATAVDYGYEFGAVL
ncbi:MAG TPA: FtsX-like permease family protein, partial [Nitrospirota bacterium]